MDLSRRIIPEADKCSALDLLTFLVGHGAAGLASRLARSLAFTTGNAALADGVIGLIQNFDVLHKCPPEKVSSAQTIGPHRP